MKNELDRLISQKTGFTSFADLVSDKHGSYTPTCRIDSDEAYRTIADAYDAHMESIGSLKRAYRVLPKKEQEIINREFDRLSRERRIAAAELKTIVAAHAAAIREDRVRFAFTPNDSVEVYSNQAWREGCVLAVIGDKVLVEYEMPGTTSKWANHPAQPTSALRVCTAVNGELAECGFGKSISYNNVPKFWLHAIRAAGMQDWIGMGQGSRTRIPFPSK